MTETRAKMLEVAGRQFAAKGYEGAHLESIASEVGVRKTALYYYFENKEALYVAVLEDMLSRFERALGEEWDATLPRREALRHSAGALNDLLAEHPTFAQILLRIFVDDVSFDSTRVRPYLERVVAGAVQFFEEGVADGTFRPLSAMHMFQSALGMAIFHYAGGSASALMLGVEDIHAPETAATRREQFVEMLLHGVLADSD